MVKKRKIPLRICIGCQEKKAKKDLIRIVRTPEGEVVLDPSGKKSGRGAYICPSAECLHKAVKGKRLERNLQHIIPEQVIRAIIEALPDQDLEQ